MKLRTFLKRTMPGVGIEPTTLESNTRPRPLPSPSHGGRLFSLLHPQICIPHNVHDASVLPERTVIVAAVSIMLDSWSASCSTKNPTLLRQQSDDLLRGARNEGVRVGVLVLRTPDGAVHLLVGFAQQIDGTLLHRVPATSIFMCSAFIKSNVFYLHTT